MLFADFFVIRNIRGIRIVRARCLGFLGKFGIWDRRFDRLVGVGIVSLARGRDSIGGWDMHKGKNGHGQTW